MVTSVTDWSNHSPELMESNFAWYNPLSWIIAIFSLIGSAFSFLTCGTDKSSIDPSRVQHPVSAAPEPQEKTEAPKTQEEIDFDKMLGLDNFLKNNKGTKEELEYGKDVLEKMRMGEFPKVEKNGHLESYRYNDFLKSLKKIQRKLKAEENKDIDSKLKRISFT